MSAPVPGAKAVYSIAWGERYDPPQGAGWIYPDGTFHPADPPPDGRKRP